MQDQSNYVGWYWLQQLRVTRAGGRLGSNSQIKQVTYLGRGCFQHHLWLVNSNSALTELMTNIAFGRNLNQWSSFSSAHQAHQRGRRAPSAGRRDGHPTAVRRSHKPPKATSMWEWKCWLIKKSFLVGDFLIMFTAGLFYLHVNFYG